MLCERDPQFCSKPDPRILSLSADHRISASVLAVLEFALKFKLKRQLPESFPMNVFRFQRVRVIVVSVGAGFIFSVGIANDDVAFQSLQKIVTVELYAVTICFPCRATGDFFLPVNIFAADKPLLAEEPCNIGR